VQYVASVQDQYNDTLIEAVAAAAARCGVRQFVLDCGWHVTKKSFGKSVSWLNNCGDWIPDPANFPTVSNRYLIR